MWLSAFTFFGSAFGNTLHFSSRFHPHWLILFVFFFLQETCTRYRYAENQNNWQIIHIWPRISVEYETLFRHEDEVVSQMPCCHMELTFSTFIVQQVEYLSVFSYMLVALVNLMGTGRNTPIKRVICTHYI